MPRPAATAGSMSDAESVKIATRRTRWAPPEVSRMIRAGSSPRPSAERLRYPHGTLGPVRADRYVHAPLQHRLDGLDARLLPGPPARAWRPGGRRRDGWCLRRAVLPLRARAVPDVRGPVRPLWPPPGDAL